MSKLQKKSETHSRQLKSITVKLNEDVFKKLSLIAKNEKRSKSSQVAFFVEQGFSNLEKQLEVESRIFS